jgi:hypothetical protein
VSHPARNVRVEVIDTLTMTVLSTDTTNENGEYRVLVDVGPNPRAVRVQALAASASAFVHPLLDLNLRRQLSSVITLNPGESIGVDLAGEGETDSNEPFSIIDAIHAIQPYVRRLRGAALPPVEVVYPAENTAFDPVTKRLRLRQYERWDWDVILHEYGHYVSLVDNLAKHPGGNHLACENLGSRMPKDDALRLAWGEGWPTYFSISGQLAEGLSTLGIPHVGDSWFQDTQDTNEDFDLRSEGGMRCPGEDNEVSTSRVLFDLEDGVADYDSVALGIKAVFDTLVSAHAHTLGEGIGRFLLHASREDSIRFGAILAWNLISPVATAPANGSPIAKTPSTFQWQGTLTAFGNNRFVVRFFDATGRKVLESPPLGGEEYTPSSTDWAVLRATTGFPITWIVYVENPENPATGPYPSGPRILTSP